MMIPLIIKSDIAIFLAALTSFIFIIALALVYFRRFYRVKKVKPSALAPTKLHAPLTISSKDIHAIAGEDVIATQLDLARAYIETGRKQLAKKILTFVIQNGSLPQQAEAERLLAIM